MSDIYREVTLNNVKEEDIGKEIKIAGWVENIRDHGGVSFIDLRDMYGVVQVVLRDTALLEGIVKEDCVSIEGLVEKRDEETYNPKIPSGTIEVEAHSIKVLGKVYTQLPFEVQTSKEIREDLRLKYRYLDLRNQKVRDNMIFRSNVISFLRQKMTEMGFMEIQTPILCASSPEGARDYIVPSRKYKGKFYALPQAPQQYKQLLMVSGFDKYFQIAPCFRDEDARADRSPGEFYQLDFEMSFATQEDVFKIGEKVLTATFEKFAPEGFEVTKAPYPIISYKQAMLEYGTDKPDLRNPLKIIDVTEFFQRCTFKPFHKKTVRAIKVHADMSKGFHEKLLKFAQSIGMGGLGYLEVLEDSVINMSTYTDNYVNPLAMDVWNLDQNDTKGWVREKGEFMLGLCEQCIGDSLNSRQKSIIDRCVRKMYIDIARSREKYIPVMSDFYDILMAQPEEEAKDIALSLELFVNGSLNIFNHQTNVDVDNRFTVYGIRDLGTELSPITMLVMMESIQQRIIENGKRGKATWLYIDEFHGARRSVA